MTLVIDSGTTNTKAFVFDGKGKILEYTYCKTKTYYPENKFVEQKADDWWKAFVSCVRKLKNKKISKIVITTQGGTFVPLDKNLNPICNGITWLDTRSSKVAEDINKIYGRKYFYFKTGHFIDGWAPLSIILWLKRYKPEIYSKIWKISFVSDYLNFKLTGKFFIDKTNAGMTTFYNIGKDKWDEELIKIAGIKEEFLPEIVSSGKIGGYLRKESARILDLEENTPIISGGHDQYCASFGAGVKDVGDCLLSCGTAWALLILTDKLIFPSETNWRPGRYLIENKFGLMGPISSGCCILDWAKRVFKGLKNCKILDKINVEVVPYFSEGKGEIKNLSLSTKPEEIYFACLKSLVFQVKNYIEQIKDKIEIKRFFLVGGGAKEKFLPGWVKEITGKDIIIPEIKEGASYGAYLLTKL